MIYFTVINLSAQFRTNLIEHTVNMDEIAAAILAQKFVHKNPERFMDKSDLIRHIRSLRWCVSAIVILQYECNESESPNKICVTGFSEFPFNLAEEGRKPRDYTFAEPFNILTDCNGEIIKATPTIKKVDEASTKVDEASRSCSLQ